MTGRQIDKQTDNRHLAQTSRQGSRPLGFCFLPFPFLGAMTDLSELKQQVEALQKRVMILENEKSWWRSWYRRWRAELHRIKEVVGKRDVTATVAIQGDDPMQMAP